MDKQVPIIVVVITLLMIVCVAFMVMGGIFLFMVQGAVVEELSSGETAVLQPVAEVPAELEPVSEQPVAEEPAVEPIPEQPVAEEPVVEEPLVEEPVVEEPVVEEPVVEEPVVEESEGISLESAMSGLSELADNLETCTNYTQTFIHPFDGSEMERRVMGLDGSDCIYQETMPNNGLMECRYSEDMRVAAAKYYRALGLAESIEGSADLSLSGDSNVITTVDGEVIENPLQEALNAELCTISGY